MTPNELKTHLLNTDGETVEYFPWNPKALTKLLLEEFNIRKDDFQMFYDDANELLEAFKGTLNADLKISSIYSDSYKNNTLKISHSYSEEFSSYSPVKCAFFLKSRLIFNIFHCFCVCSQSCRLHLDCCGSKKGCLAMLCFSKLFISGRQAP